RAVPQHLPDQHVVFALRAVAPVDCVRLRKLRRLGDPVAERFQSSRHDYLESFEWVVRHKSITRRSKECREPDSLPLVRLSGAGHIGAPSGCRESARGGSFRRCGRRIEFRYSPAMQGLAELFSRDGALARRRRDFTYRDAQRQMAEIVGAAMEDGQHVAIEAGTGIGKTFAYLAPALLSGRKAIIST